LDERLKQALDALRSFGSEAPQQEMTTDLKSALGIELATTMRLLGAKGDFAAHYRQLRR
jgi:hypothetical protein